ncbi:hypothetical protein ABZ769_14445 [Streptomyces olivoreticuli]
MTRAKDRAEVAERIRGLLADCLGGELGGYDSLRATFELEIAKQQVARMEKGMTRGDFSSNDVSRAWLNRNLPEARKRVEVAAAELERLDAENARRMEQWEAEYGPMKDA